MMLTGCAGGTDTNSAPAGGDETAASEASSLPDQPYDVGPTADPAGVQACKGLGIDALVFDAVGPSTLNAAVDKPGEKGCVFTIPTDTKKTDEIVLNLLEVSYEKNPAVPYDVAIKHSPGGTEMALGDRTYMGSRTALNTQIDVMLIEVDGALVRVNGLFESTNIPPNWNATTQEALGRKALEVFLR